MSDLMTTKEAAEYLRKSPSWLACDRWKGATIPYTKSGGRIIYYKKDLDEYLQNNRVEPYNGKAA